jgi:hypothetical protein
MPHDLDPGLGVAQGAQKALSFARPPHAQISAGRLSPLVNRQGSEGGQDAFWSADATAIDGLDKIVRRRTGEHAPVGMGMHGPKKVH